MDKRIEQQAEADDRHPIGMVEVRFIKKVVFPIYNGTKTPGQMIDEYLTDIDDLAQSITLTFDD